MVKVSAFFPSNFAVVDDEPQGHRSAHLAADHLLPLPRIAFRKRIGVAAVFFLSIFVIMSYFAKRRVWADLH